MESACLWGKNLIKKGARLELIDLLNMTPHQQPINITVTVQASVQAGFLSVKQLPVVISYAIR